MARCTPSSTCDVSGPLDRILRKTGVPGLVEILSDRLGATDLQSLLLEVYRRRAQAGRPGELMERYAKSRFARPSGVPAARLVELDALALSLLPEGFEALDLSPVAPLGATAIVTGTSQNRIVSTVRNTEVAADSTNAMALECAERRRERLAVDPKSSATVKLAASQRLVRAQQMEGARHFAHFRLFGLCTAGRDTGAFEFELTQLVEHVGFHVRLLEAWCDRGAELGRVRVPITVLDGGPAEDHVVARAIEPLSAAHPDVEFSLDATREQGRNYYASLCFKVYAESQDVKDAKEAGDQKTDLLEVGDGGLTDWTQQLVGSRKERLLISGIGSERLAGLV